MFFLNFYDGLMNYSGTGHVDWWMGATGWSPALAATTALPARPKPVTVGMLDFTVTSGTENAKGALLQYGALNVSNGHGAAVGSLIIGSVDGSEHHGRDAGRRRPTSSSTIPTTPQRPPTGPTSARASIRSANSIFSHDRRADRRAQRFAGRARLDPQPGLEHRAGLGRRQGHNLVIAAGNDGMTQTSNVPGTSPRTRPSSSWARSAWTGRSPTSPTARAKLA